MNDILNRIWFDLSNRPSGPLAFRLYLQPAIAIFFAIRDGVQDAKHGRPPYLWSIVTHPQNRQELIRDGWKSIAKIFILALVIDAAYQLMILNRLYPGEMLIVATGLAVIPYALLRGPSSRLLRHRVLSSGHPTERRRDRVA